jgi:hypothetical protein
MIDPTYHWAQGVLGTVKNPPDHILAMADGWSGHTRKVQAVRGTMLFHWISFDHPQLDADGDGPYNEAEVDVEFLRLARGDA